MNGYLELLQGAYELRSGTKLAHLTARSRAPFGYEFDVSPAHDLQQMALVLENHHQAYTVAAEQATAFLLEEGHLFLANHLIPQPSYRLFISVDAGQVEAVICPEFRSHAGVMEALGVRLHRSPDNLRRKTPDELDFFFARLGQHLSGQAL